MDVRSSNLAYVKFRELPGERGRCPDCRCCGQLLRACNHRWEGVLKVKTDAITHYYDFAWTGYRKIEGVKSMEVGFGCAMDALLETSGAKHHTELTLYWAHVLNIFALMKGPEVAKYVAMGGRLKPRQEMEKRFLGVYLSVEEVLQLMTGRERAHIYALSYCWQSAKHPDPTGSTAKTVMQGLEKKEKDRDDRRKEIGIPKKSFVCEGREDGENLFSNERGGKREKREGEEDEETWMEKYFQRTSTNTLPENTYDFPVYFQDFTSLHQWLPVKGRTPEENALFKQGLGLLSCNYRNTSIDVYFIRCTDVPVELEGVTNKTPYHKRGWTNFESRVAAVKFGFSTIHLGPLTGTLEQVLLSPPAFQRLLEEKRLEERTDDNKEGFVVRFTNGKEDRPLVANLYRAFVLDTQVRGQKKIEMRGKYNIDTKEKGEMLGEYFAWMGEQSECQVEEVYLEHCEFNDDSLPPIAAGLRALSSLRKLDLSRTNLGSPPCLR
uniref:Uncharacterized protein n=1 Tax=Chromera velia CCMP2878 TaxID=1169474 RepID=A0A0G4FL13_9ALVE|eukprot:Cvel_17428.t1-p1 / transcript=Cvel_17428.t1 / gene=Cvel_17428 / organism=Chromera_velia_CCMP2878 / gene_product=hypothetical protein / transcript_product=hypothetical protein / location=Cvel_scaffold1389:32003-33478(-) / protein_length=492 / sequence_SO=supercontig / SO=protein_coding / is_pseudo=false